MIAPRYCWFVLELALSVVIVCATTLGIPLGLIVGLIVRDEAAICAVGVNVEGKILGCCEIIGTVVGCFFDGEIDGLYDGLTLGIIVGLTLGIIDGLYDGLLLGTIVGLIDGILVGTLDGTNDGNFEGFIVGLLGEGVGLTEGVLDGTRLGAVGDVLGMAVEGRLVGTSDDTKEPLVGSEVDWSVVEPLVGSTVVATDGTALAPYERLKLSKSVYDGSVGQPSSWLNNFNVYEWPGIKLVTTCFQDIPAVPGQVLSIFQATLPTVLSNNVAFAQSKVTESGQIILYQNDSWVWSDAATKVWLTTELASRGIDEPSMAQLPL